MIGAKKIWASPSTTLMRSQIHNIFSSLKKNSFFRKKINVYQSGAGFTLIELLITASIFSVAALLATTVFSNIQHTQRKIQNQQRINADGRYVIETIARSIRTGSINYGMFTSSVVSPNPATAMSTIDQDGKVTCYRLNDTNKTVEVASNAAASCPTTSSWVAFTPDDVQVDTLSFFVTPTSDPFRPIPRSSGDCLNNYDTATGACTCAAAADCFTGQACTSTTPTVKICTNPNTQPHVTIFISAKSKNAGTGEGVSSALQTTVTSRLYQ